MAACAGRALPALGGSTAFGLSLAGRGLTFRYGFALGLGNSPDFHFPLRGTAANDDLRLFLSTLLCGLLLHHSGADGIGPRGFTHAFQGLGGMDGTTIPHSILVSEALLHDMDGLEVLVHQKSTPAQHSGRFAQCAAPGKEVTEHIARA